MLQAIILLLSDIGQAIVSTGVQGPDEDDEQEWPELPGTQHGKQAGVERADPQTIQPPPPWNPKDYLHHEEGGTVHIVGTSTAQPTSEPSPTLSRPHPNASRKGGRKKHQ